MAWFRKSKPALQFSSYDEWNALIGYPVTSVTRETSLKVPAVKRARDVYASLGALPLHEYQDLNRIDSSLLDQPEKTVGLTKTVTMSYTIDDLFFYGQSLWVTSTRDWTGFPSSVERIEHSRYSIDVPTSTVTVDGTKVPNDDVILFTSPNEGILKTSSSTILSMLALERAATSYIATPRAAEYWRSTMGQELSEDEVKEFLASVQKARQAGSVGWIPDGVERIPGEKILSAEDMQLQGAREFGILEISRATGLPPSWLSVSPGASMTYTNSIDQRKDLIDFAGSAYLRSIEERLSLNDVCPRGHYVKWNYSAFLRSNVDQRYDSYDKALNGTQPWLTVDEVRSLENIAPMGESDGG
jgi:hypothetical protein